MSRKITGRTVVADLFHSIDNPTGFHYSLTCQHRTKVKVDSLAPRTPSGGIKREPFALIGFSYHLPVPRFLNFTPIHR